MARIVGYIASSLDGFIAAPDESLQWLFTRGDAELGEYDYREFIKRIRTVVMGRTTYDWLVNEGSPWAYGDQRAIRRHLAAHPRPEGSAGDPLGRRRADRRAPGARRR